MLTQHGYNFVFVRHRQTINYFLGTYGRFMCWFFDKYEWMCTSVDNLWNTCWCVWVVHFI